MVDWTRAHECLARTDTVAQIRDHGRVGGFLDFTSIHLPVKFDRPSLDPENCFRIYTILKHLFDRPIFNVEHGVIVLGVLYALSDLLTCAAKGFLH